MELSVFIVLMLMILLLAYQMGFKAGVLSAKQRINMRVDKVLSRMTFDAKQNFNAVLSEVIKEEKK